jgi:hypothetical protein
MGKGTSYATDLLKGVFQQNNITNLANFNTGTANLYLALHTADPSAGNQNTNEITYTSYGRVSVARSTAGWTVSGNNVVNNGVLSFPACTGGSANANYVSIGENTTGTGGEIYYSGALNASLAISNGITPQFANAALEVIET